MLAQAFDLLKLENLKGLRTTIIYGLIIIGIHMALYTGNLDQSNYVDILKWSFGLYVGGKFAYKGAEAYQSKFTGEKTAVSS